MRHKRDRRTSVGSRANDVIDTGDDVCVVAAVKERRE